MTESYTLTIDQFTILLLKVKTLLNSRLLTVGSSHPAREYMTNIPKNQQITYPREKLSNVNKSRPLSSMYCTYNICSMYK